MSASSPEAHEPFAPEAAATSSAPRPDPRDLQFDWTEADLWRVPEVPGRYFIRGLDRGRQVLEGRCLDQRRRLLQGFYRPDLPFSPVLVVVSPDYR